MALNTYTVYLSPKAEPEDATFIKEGFCWHAFLLGPVWLMCKKIWLFALLALVIMLMAISFQEYVPSLWILTYPALSIYIGFCGTDMLQSQLQKGNYQLIAALPGRNLEDARSKFYDKYAESLYKPDGTSKE